MLEPNEKESSEPRWKQIPNLKPPVKSFKFREGKDDPGDPSEVDEFNRMIREMRNNDRGPRMIDE